MSTIGEVRAVIDMERLGVLSAEQALNVIAITVGHTARSAESVAIGDLITQVSNGTLPARELIKEIEG